MNNPHRAPTDTHLSSRRRRVDPDAMRRFDPPLVDRTLLDVGAVSDVEVTITGQHTGVSKRYGPPRLVQRTE
jgi:hypothetical protein